LAGNSLPGWFWIAIVVEGTRQKHSPEIHTPSEKPRRRSSTKVAYHCSQVASHAALASEGFRMAQSNALPLSTRIVACSLAQRQLTFKSKQQRKTNYVTKR